MTLEWVKVEPGIYAAAGRGHRLYMAIKHDHTWSLESWCVVPPGEGPDTIDGYKHRRDTYREAEELEEMHGLLSGKYSLGWTEAMQVMRTAREEGAATVATPDGTTLRIATDPGGYTVEQIA